MSLFDIRKQGPQPRNSLLTPNAAAKRGVLFQESATAGTAELADGSKQPVGHLTREVTLLGPDLGDAVYPGRIERPFKATQDATFEAADEIELEGSDYLVISGTGLVDGTTARGVLLSALSGKLRVRQAGEYPLYEVVENMSAAPEVAGNIRLRVRKIYGAKA